MAIITVLFSSGREFYQSITYKPKIDFIFSSMSFAKNPQDGELPETSPQKAEILIVNSEDRFVTIGTSIKCKIINKKHPSIIVQASMVLLPTIEGRIYTGDYYAFSGKSQYLLIYSNVAFGGGDIDKMLEPTPKDGNVAQIQTDCYLKYYFDGKLRDEMVQWVGWVDKPR